MTLRLKGITLAIAIAIVAEGCARNPKPGQPVSPTRPNQSAFTITAYCHGTRTAAGTRVGEGVVAADVNLLPLGTVIRLSGLAKRYNGVYRVLDTGPDIRGRRLDLYLENCREAIRFGRRAGRVSIVSTGG